MTNKGLKNEYTGVEEQVDKNVEGGERDKKETKTYGRIIRQIIHIDFTQSNNNKDRIAN